MKILMDSCALLWWLEGSSRFESGLVEQVEKPSNSAYVSSATVWELHIKRASGKLKLDARVIDALSATGFIPLDINFFHARAAAELPKLHKDPFDRMLVAQALSEGMSIVTSDRKMKQYGVKTILI